MSNLNDSILVNPSDEHIKALLSKLAYENLSTGFNFSNLNSNFWDLYTILAKKKGGVSSAHLLFLNWCHI